MFISKKTNKEFHSNGQIKYIETIALIKQDKAHLFDNKIINDNGDNILRIGHCAKYYDNGQLAWELNYDNNGVLIKNNKPSFRKDGSVIVH